MSYCEQTGYPIEGRTEVVSLTLFCCAGMKRHAHPHRADFCPVLLRERLLRDKGGGKRIGGSGKGGTEGIADRFEDMAVMLGDGLFQQGVMAGKSCSHGFWILLPELGAALDVREEEGDGPSWQAHDTPQQSMR